VSFRNQLLSYGNTKFNQPNFSDRVLDKFFLWIFPDFITPNHLTKFRYFTIPVVFYLLLTQNYLSGLVFFCISAFSDALDGAMARTRNRITEWGKLHDPLADKLLIGTSGAVLITRYLSLRIILIILILEFITVISAIHLYDKKEKDFGARIPGKLKMICQSVAIILLLIYTIVAHSEALWVSGVLLYFAIVLSIINIFLYRVL